VKHTDKYKWSYARTNSKGEAKFRHDTNESLDEVTKYLEDLEIDYEIVEKIAMLWIYHNEKQYCYYYTTGRWGTYSLVWPPVKHYSSKGIKDFLDRFVFDNTKRPDFEKIESDIDSMILNDIKDAGKEGTTQKKVLKKYQDLEEWKLIKAQGSFSRLVKRNLIFYLGDKEGRSKIMRHIDYNES